jgi:DNA invertase Pin-like site-specific DNA recombinase
MNSVRKRAVLYVRVSTDKQTVEIWWRQRERASLTRECF